MYMKKAMASSHIPLPLSDAARAALDDLCRHVADSRIEEQQATIVRLQKEVAQKDEILEQELAKKDEIIARLKLGYDLEIRHIWQENKKLFPTFQLHLRRELYPLRLHDFLGKIKLMAAREIFRKTPASGDRDAGRREEASIESNGSEED